MGRRFLNVYTLLVALAIALLGCQRSPATAPAALPVVTDVALSPGPEWFEDVTEKLGINFVHESGARGEYFMPESIGSGAAVFDYDNDGRLDIYLIQNGGTNAPAKNQLYHQEPDGHFQNVSAGSGLDIVGRGMGVAIGDINNDGFPEVLVCEYGAVRLFLNNGGKGTFTGITEEAGIDNPHWASSAAFFDYDRDGWLDLVIANYVTYDESQLCPGRDGNLEYCSPGRFNHGTVTKLFHNLGKSAGGDRRGGFEDVTCSSGLDQVRGPGMGVVCADFNGDGWPDIFVTDDIKPNRLFINNHDGTFKNEAYLRGIALNIFGQDQSNMGIAISDVNGDGLFDIFVPHIDYEKNVLWNQVSPGYFQDRTAVAGLSTSQWHGTGFSGGFADFTNKGAPDLAVVNGRVSRKIDDDNSLPSLVPGLGPFWSPYADRSQLFSNDGTGKFRDISEANPSFCKDFRVGRGLAVGDIDNDGGMDLLVTSINGPAKLYRNVVPNRGHWLLVRATEPALGGRDAYGAKVTIAAGGRHRVSWIIPGYSYQCSNDPRAHFGLGQAHQVDEIEVEWPDGTRESFPTTGVDKLVVLRHGEGQPEAQGTARSD